METKELKIQIPEGYCIDESKSTFEKIVFKKIDNKPRSWKEYCDNFKGQYCYIQDNRDNIGISFTPNGFISAYKNILPTKELAEVFLAMMQLMSLRKAWIGDWDSTKLGNAIILNQEGNFMATFDKYHRSLTFPNRKMALDFMNTFKDLLDVARPLI